MQIIRKILNRIKSNYKLFQFLSEKLHKFFNVLEKNDLVIIPGDKRPHRILDFYTSGNIDVLCDEDPSPIRTRINRFGVLLYKKWFRGTEGYRDEKHDNGWRLFVSNGKIGFYNFKTKEVLKKDKTLCK